MRVAKVMAAELALGLTLLGLTVATAAWAAPPNEPVEARLSAINPASRQIEADGVTWALESTAAIRMPGRQRASLRDLTPGMNVRLELAPGDDPAPRVRTITVLPD
jgi:hypothetical protein